MKRTLFLWLIMALFPAFVLIQFFINKEIISYIPELLLLTVSFLILFFLSVVSDRVNENLIYEGTSYSAALITSVVSFSLLILFSILSIYLDSSYIMPYMIPGMLFSLIFNERISVFSSSFLSFITAFTLGGDILSLFIPLFLMLSGVAITIFLKENEEKINLFSTLFVSFYTLLSSLIMWYLKNHVINLYCIINILILAAISAVFLILLFSPLKNLLLKEEYISYKKISDKEYALIKELKRFSKEEYDHAIKTAEISKKCASLLGRSEELLYCGGLYYRIGRMLGQPEITNAVKEAKKRCFPPELINIISEYNGIAKSISTPESAIVQMVNAYVEKMETLSLDTKENSWNREMIVYQMLNDFSKDSLYDDSGLSMNLFLKVREALTKEDI